MGICRICGEESIGISFIQWCKPTFTDHDKLIDGDVVCDSCLFWFDERSEELARIVGKEKPQRMRNYSHFVVGGEWIPLSKGDKRKMAHLLLEPPFPELAAIAESGQKHIVFRAPRNPQGGTAGWVQFEEQRLFVNPPELETLLDDIEQLYEGFSKGEIGSCQYKGYRVLRFGLDRWRELESRIRDERGSLSFTLALFLAQKGKSDGRNAPNGGKSADDRLAGNSGGLQESISDEHLAAVRGSNQVGSVHQQSGKVHQLSLFGPRG